MEFILEILVISFLGLIGAFAISIGKIDSIICGILFIAAAIIIIGFLAYDKHEDRENE